ncbi:protocatechuate 3,4-dioxygenase [uncultured Castellaniella sp.]|uniref:protocatechuate 3,4-dioxygenase n=1 Tax=uncultured Castellaniella sp. TaxID=647907 RepID=UPI00263189B1|nr:protocatechuate 3,4-dioxygenase [uncultured Castellaniella sp.]
MMQLDPGRPIPDVLIFNLSESRKGYRINKLCDSLTVEANRRAFQADEEAYLSAHGLSEAEKDLIRARDWAGLNAAGGNIYYLLKLGFVTGHGLYRMGAQMRGETFEAFLASRNGKGAR